MITGDVFQRSCQVLGIGGVETICCAGDLLGEIDSLLYLVDSDDLRAASDFCSLST